MTHSPWTLWHHWLLIRLLMDESLWLIPCLLIHYSYAYWLTDSSDCSAHWVMLTQLDYWSITVRLLMDPVLYLDIDCYLYKTALSIPKTSDLSWLSSHTKNPLYPLASCNTRPFLEPLYWVILRNTKTFQKAPLSAALPSRLYHLLCLERQASWTSNRS